jgi:hypothetical protein
MSNILKSKDILAALVELTEEERDQISKKCLQINQEEAKKNLEPAKKRYEEALALIRKVEPSYGTPAADNVGNLINKELEKAGGDGLTTAELVAALNKPEAKISEVLTKYSKDGWKIGKDGKASGKARYTQDNKTNKWTRINKPSI